ncbi:hypothetical protein ACHAW5_001965 [Stephanodiscus triporus]|uniref:PDZ domain-containing protein n=1 Tax=Stephanodiscus triporus TaxID=2934178 RepID=A0ABD3QT46_9STRA
MIGRSFPPPSMGETRRRGHVCRRLRSRRRHLSPFPVAVVVFPLLLQLLAGSAVQRRQLLAAAGGEGGGGGGSYDCSFEYDVECDEERFSATASLSFRVLADVGGDAYYEATSTFLWGTTRTTPDDGEEEDAVVDVAVGAKEEKTSSSVVSDVYAINSEQVLIDAHQYDDIDATRRHAGVGYRLTFGRGSGSGCDGETFEGYYVAWFEGGSCGFYDYGYDYYDDGTTTTGAPTTAISYYSVVAATTATATATTADDDAGAPTVLPTGWPSSYATRPSPSPKVDYDDNVHHDSEATPPSKPAAEDGDYDDEYDDEGPAPRDDDDWTPAHPSRSPILDGRRPPPPRHPDDGKTTRPPASAMIDVPPTTTTAEEEEGEDWAVASQMLTEEDDSGGADREVDGRNYSALIASATSAILSCVIILALGMHLAGRSRKGRTTEAAKDSPGTRSDAVDGSANIMTEPRIAETGRKSDALSDGGGYFGTILVRECVSREEASDGGSKIDDVSTLGDPFAGESFGSERDHSDYTVGESFSIRRQYNTKRKSRMEGSTVHSCTSPMTVSAGMTLEDIYQTHPGLADFNLDLVTVVAPGGKLGIVLDNPSGVVPVVHAVSKRSALRDEVLVGDLLLSVDEVDCKGMSCRDVSILLGSRSHNAARTLVLARGSAMNHAIATASSVA